MVMMLRTASTTVSSKWRAVVAMSCIQQPGSTPAQAWSDLPTVSRVTVSSTEKPDQPDA